MPIRFDKLFELMHEKGLTTYKIRKNRIISEGTLQKLRENSAVSTESIAALCAVFGNVQYGFAIYLERAGLVKSDSYLVGFDDVDTLAVLHMLALENRGEHDQRFQLV